MRQKKTVHTMLLVLLMISLCYIGRTQQQLNSEQVSKLQTINKLSNQKQQNEVIKFHQPNKQSTHITVNQKQYAYLPEINQDYNIVHTDIYPKTQQKGKFVASLPSDNFVNKLKQTTEQIKKSQSTQNQLKADDILKTQSVQQDKKIQQEKKTQQNAQQTKQKIPTQTIQLQQQDNKQQQKQQEHKRVQKQQEDLFVINDKKQYPQIEKTQRKIKFKQDQFSQPLKIKNYPFQQTKIGVSNKINTQNNKQQEFNNQNKVKQQKQRNERKQVQQVRTQQKVQKKVEEKPIVKIQPQKKIQVETKKQQKVLQKPNLQIQKQQKNEQQQIEKKFERKPQNQPERKIQKPLQKLQSQKSQQAISKQKKQQLQQSFNIDQEYKKLSKMLSIDKQQLRSYLQYENKVQDDISDRDWKFLLAKVLMWIVIVIAIYQALCSSQSRLSKAEKEKYAPVQTQMFDSRDHLEDGQMQERK